eukprot:589361-Amphidinium_carterae.1
MSLWCAAAGSRQAAALKTSGTRCGETPRASLRWVRKKRALHALMFVSATPVCPALQSPRAVTAALIGFPILAPAFRMALALLSLRAAALSRFCSTEVRRRLPAMI